MTTALVGCGSPEPPVAAPNSGALFGAYVDPAEYTENERIAAYEGFEERLGRRLDIYHAYHRWADPFPSEADRYFAARGRTLLLSWAGTDTARIVSGRDDALIRARAQALDRLDQPVLLRWRWEMNRPNLAPEIRSGSDYIAAWQHIHDIFAEVGADKVGWVWCPLSDARADPDYSAYYPGDDYVDWVCADGYARSATQSFEQVFKPFLDWTTEVEKPILIGEFGREQGTPGSRADWLQAAQAFVEDTPQIKAVVYFESARGASGNYSVVNEHDALNALRAWANAPYFKAR